MIVVHGACAVCIIPKKRLFAQRGLIHAKEVQCVLPVLDRSIVRPDMRESFEPDKPRAIDLTCHPGLKPDRVSGRQRFPQRA